MALEADGEIPPEMKLFTTDEAKNELWTKTFEPESTRLGSTPVRGLYINNRVEAIFFVINALKRCTLLCGVFGST